ncbi:MAG: hypothetical protein MZV65_35995 [Chromatiales bacterium]|nr:hypothetical protein [Chromatiales bacterium]
MELQTLLLEMANDPTAQDALASIGVERFVLIDDSAYDSVRACSASSPLQKSAMIMQKLFQRIWAIAGAVSVRTKILGIVLGLVDLVRHGRHNPGALCA